MDWRTDGEHQRKVKVRRRKLAGRKWASPCCVRGTSKVRGTRLFFSCFVILSENMAKAERNKEKTPMNPSKGAKGVSDVRDQLSLA